MSRHLNEEALMEALEGSADERARRHLESCLACAARVSEAREGWALAERAAIPEPSPLYWDVFREQVGRRLEEASVARRRFGAWWPALLAATAGVVAAVTFINPFNPARPRHTADSKRLVPAWTAPAEASSFEVFEATADDALLAGDCGDLTDCLMELSDDEAQALAEILDEDLGKTP